MSSGIGRVINKGSMEGSTGSPTIRVEIYNQTYNIRSDGDTEYIIQLAEFVDSRMREISSGTLTVDSLKVAILAALHIADELHRLKNMHEQADSQLAARSAEFVEGSNEPRKRAGRRRQTHTWLATKGTKSTKWFLLEEYFDPS
jgi:cell division protein ZapA